MAYSVGYVIGVVFIYAVVFAVAKLIATPIVGWRKRIRLGPAFKSGTTTLSGVVAVVVLLALRLFGG